MTSLNDLIKDSRKIEIRAKGLVDDNLSGEYKTAFKGRGIDFHDLREYLHGDEVRSIDWNTTARTGDPYVKQFVEQWSVSIQQNPQRPTTELFLEALEKQWQQELSALVAGRLKQLTAPGIRIARPPQPDNSPKAPR